MKNYLTINGRWLLLTIFLLILLSCEDNNVEPTEKIKERASEVLIEEEISKTFSENAFEYDIFDCSDLVISGNNFSKNGLSFNNSTYDVNLIENENCDNFSPVSCSTFGSRDYLKVNNEAIFEFDEKQTLLGMHLSFDKDQFEKLQGLKPEKGEGIAYLLPTFKVLITGIDENGKELNTIRAIVASADYSETVVKDDWYFVNTELLGEIASFKIKIESPMDNTNYILVDNIVYSNEFEHDNDYFTIALIPDTQKYTEKEYLHDIFYSQTKYLADNFEEEKILFISHLGDIVENGDIESEWMVADKAFKMLDGVVPYAVVIGNHDYVDEWNNPNLGSPFFNKYFPESRFDKYDWWLEYAPDKLSSCQKFTTPLGDFLYFHFSVDSPPPTLEWAQSIIDRYPNIPTLVTTHVYLRENGRIPVPYLTPALEGIDWNGISADELFDTFIAVNPQIFMVTCGHISSEYLQISYNNKNMKVYEMLQDYQNRVNGGEGFLRLLRFYPSRRNIQIITLSTWLNTYEVDEDSYFQLDFNF